LPDYKSSPIDAFLSASSTMPIDFSLSASNQTSIDTLLPAYHTRPTDDPLPGYGWAPVAGSCEHGNEPSGSIRGNKYLTT